MPDLNVSGLVPALTGENWFLFDKSGVFSVDKNISVTLYLVGGGCDGGDGFNDFGIVHGGNGGNGGKTVKLNGFRLKSDVEYKITVADVNDISGTSIVINGDSYSCGRQGCVYKIGGIGGVQTIYGTASNPQNGGNGVLTPYGYVGSSGSGGVACSERGFTNMSYGGAGAGGALRHFHPKYTPIVNIPLWRENNALNYGCGGGGNTFCSVHGNIAPKSKGKQGCVIIEWSEINLDDNSPDFSVAYFKNPSDFNTKSISNELEVQSRDISKENNLQTQIDTLAKQSDEAEIRNNKLRLQIAELRSQISELENGDEI